MVYFEFLKSTQIKEDLFIVQVWEFLAFIRVFGLEKCNVCMRKKKAIRVFLCEAHTRKEDLVFPRE